VVPWVERQLVTDGSREVEGVVVSTGPQVGGFRCPKMDYRGRVWLPSGAFRSNPNKVTVTTMSKKIMLIILQESNLYLPAAKRRRSGLRCSESHPPSGCSPLKAEANGALRPTGSDDGSRRLTGL